MTNDDGHNDASYRIVGTLDELDAALRGEYWRRLEATLRDVFGRKNTKPLIESYRERLRQAGPETELHAYHVDPLQVAADLVGREAITPQEKAAYSAVLASSGRKTDRPEDRALDYRVPEDVLPNP